MSNSIPCEPEAVLDPWRDPALSLAAAQRIDEVCQTFERAWQAGSAPSIENCLSDWSGLERTALLRELLSLDIDYRRRRGDAVKREDYVQRFPAEEGAIELALLESSHMATAADAPPPELAGHPRYRIVRLLGRGGMGAVYLAEHRVLKRQVAIKVIKPELVARPGMAERFALEGTTAARLNHPHIVAALDADSAVDVRFFVMEFVSGIDLAKLVADRGPLPCETACEYIRQAALGLQHAHERGMVHRDISPRNLMLTDEGQIKILDFGLARLVSETQSPSDLTGEGAVLGSVDFISPEQAADPRQADIRADIYGLGCTLFYLLSGRPPFAQGSAFQRLKAHAEQPPPALGEARSEVPTELNAIVKRMLAKRPADRFQTPGEVAEVLLPFTIDHRPNRDAANGKARSRWPLTSARSLVVAACMIVYIAGHVIYVATQGLRRGPDGHSQSLFVANLPPDDKRAYDEAIYLLGKRQEGPVRDAIKRLAPLTDNNPDFAAGRVALADAYNLCGDYGWDPANEAFPLAKAAAREALRLDPNLASAHLALAFSLHAHDCDWPAAEAEYRRALELDPRSPAAHHWFAWFLVEQRRLDEAERHIDEAQRLAPVDMIVVDNVGAIRYYCREYALAIEKHRHTLELDPGFRVAHYHLGLALAEVGRLDDALAEFDRASGLTEGDRDIQAARAYTLARNGRPAEARRILETLQDAPSPTLVYELAVVCTALGDSEEAFAWLNKAIDQQSAGRSKLKIDPRLDALRSDPRFKHLLRQINLGD